MKDGRYSGSETTIRFRTFKTEEVKTLQKQSDPQLKSILSLCSIRQTKSRPLPSRPMGHSEKTRLAIKRRFVDSKRQSVARGESRRYEANMV